MIIKNIKDVRVAIPVVLIAGIIWSFGPVVVRNIDNPQLVPWQYLFTRGLVIFTILNFYLFFTEGKNFLKNYLRIGFSGILGGAGLACAMISFIWSITTTTAAVTLLMLAAMPFIAALLGFIFLKEKISISTWFSIILAAIGIVIMALNSNKILQYFIR